MKKKVIAFGCALALVLAVVLPSALTYAQVGGGNNGGSMGGQCFYSEQFGCDTGGASACVFCD